MFYSGFDKLLNRPLLDALVNVLHEFDGTLRADDDLIVVLNVRNSSPSSLCQ